jgi:rhodanese-related sulfurtransferase
MKMKMIYLLFFFAVGMAACTTQAQNDAHVYQSKQNKPMFQDLSPEEFKAKAEANKNAVILDVRTAQEIAEGSIKGHIHIDAFAPDFAQQVEKLDKSKTYFIYCRSGRRSANACQIMAQKGFKELYNLDGGYMAWDAAF